MASVAVLGLGAMGARMAGHGVVVWNRSPGSAARLAQAGAKVAQSPRQAAAQADFVLSMVRDDEASRQVWLDPGYGALAGMARGAAAIESSTLTPGWIRDLSQAMTAKAVTLVEAPVSGSRPQAEAGQLVFFVGADLGALERVRPLLEVMGSAIRHVGRPGVGALVKLATNALMGVQVTALAELIGMLDRAGADAKSALEAVATTLVWSPLAKRTVDFMLARNFAPQFPVDLIEKDFRYALETAGGPAAAPTLAAARAVFQEAIARGLGAANHTSVLTLFSGQHAAADLPAPPDSPSSR